MTRVAAVDCGTNTIKLLVADLDPASGREVELAREMRVVRLGQDVDRTGRLAEAALDRVFGAVEEYAEVVAGLTPGRGEAVRIRFCATSAVRDADNAEEFLGGVERRLGVRPEVVTGDQEARLAFTGATRALTLAPAAELVEPVLVLDIGGGSTELVLGRPGDPEPVAHSLDIGSVRLTERHLPSDPPTSAEVAAARREVDVVLDKCRVDPADAGTVVGVAGTVTTVAAGVLELPGYDRAAIHRAVLPRAAVHRTAADLLATTVAGRRALPYMHPGRADVIGAGALILDRVLARSGVGALLVSEADILDGIAWSLV